MKTMEPDRVRRHTSEQINRRIDENLATTIDKYTGASPGALTMRIEELDAEWDIERTLQTNASLLALAGVALAITTDRRWLALSGGVMAFLLLHGTKGWCPPLPLFRGYGVRTRSEIEREKYALKYLRGDFDAASTRGRFGQSPLVNAVNR